MSRQLDSQGFKGLLTYLLPSSLSSLTALSTVPAVRSPKLITRFEIVYYWYYWLLCKGESYTIKKGKWMTASTSAFLLCYAISCMTAWENKADGLRGFECSFEWYREKAMAWKRGRLCRLWLYDLKAYLIMLANMPGLSESWWEKRGLLRESFE